MSDRTGLWFLLLAGVGFFIGLSATPLIDLDEGAFTAATKEMFVRGDFLATYLNGEPRYDKPILIYWLQAASVTLFGWNEFALRLPSALMGLAWMLLAYHVAARLYDRETAIAAAFVTATSLGVVIIARIATADALLDACIAAAVFFQYLWFRFRRTHDLLLAWLAMGLGFLAKGPVAVVIPMGALFFHCISLGRWRDFWQFALNWRGILLWAAIALPWYVAVTWVKGPEFIESFFLKHNVGRFSGAMGDHHASGYLYYFPVLLFATMPYTGLMLPLLARIKQLWQTDDFARYALILFVMVFVLFSLSANKLPHYLLYGFSGLLVLLGRQMIEAKARWQLLPALLLCASLFILPDFLEWARERANVYYQVMLVDLPAHFDWGYRLVTALAAVFILLCMIDRRYPMPLKLAVSGLMTVASVAFLFLPALGGVLQDPVRNAGLFARKLEAPVVMDGINVPSFGVYAKRIVERRPPKPGEVLLTITDRLDTLPPHRVLFREKNIVLVQTDP